MSCLTVFLYFSNGPIFVTSTYHTNTSISAAAAATTQFVFVLPGPGFQFSMVSSAFVCPGAFLELQVVLSWWGLQMSGAWQVQQQYFLLVVKSGGWNRLLNSRLSSGGTTMGHVGSPCPVIRRFPVSISNGKGLVLQRFLKRITCLKMPSPLASKFKNKLKS